ncbi:hypothetical protein LOZ57_006902, partial [Ophidiomyces ophidiicola]|uniref:uncharacterized protein n=1 Tax=Ophidiomyces ophidiicola TaxID=1387563 RepID=UPI0020C4F937
MILEEFDMGFGYRGYWEMEGVLPGNSNTLIEALREFYAPASMKATLQRQPNSQPNGLENAIRTEPESFWRPGGELGLAVSITASDCAMYAHMAVQDMGRCWDRRCREAQRCIQAIPESVGFFWSLAWHFRILRNFHSLTAILQALKATRKKDQGHLYSLLDPEGRYQKCRDAFSMEGGIPFMFAEMAHRAYQQELKQRLLDSEARSQLSRTHIENEWDGRMWFDREPLDGRIFVWF